MSPRKCLTCGRTEDQPVEYGCRDCQGWAGEPAPEVHKTFAEVASPRANLVALHVVAALQASGANTQREREMVLRALQAYEKARSGR